MNADEAWMQTAIDIARQGIAAGQTPFGAVIVRNDQLIVAAHNVVWRTTDVTAHAEVHALRLACAQLRTIDLTGCTIYTTCEPCPMCFSACHWGKLDRIVYGATIADAQRAGFSELTIPAKEMKRLGGSPMQVTGGVLSGPCAALFQEWLGQASRRVY